MRCRRSCKSPSRPGQISSWPEACCEPTWLTGRPSSKTRAPDARLSGDARCSLPVTSSAESDIGMLSGRLLRKSIVESQTAIYFEAARRNVGPRSTWWSLSCAITETHWALLRLLGIARPSFISMLADKAANNPLPCKQNVCNGFTGANGTLIDDMTRMLYLQGGAPKL